MTLTAPTVGLAAVYTTAFLRGDSARDEMDIGEGLWHLYICTSAGEINVIFDRANGVSVCFGKGFATEILGSVLKTQAV